jgi:hypothetical protein
VSPVETGSADIRSKLIDQEHQLAKLKNELV